MSRIKELKFCRYGGTAYRNGSYSYKMTVLPGVPWDPLMIHYSQLITVVERETLADDGRQQQFANFMTTLNSFLSFVGKTHSSPIGPELGRHFEESCRRYCESIALSERTIRDRRSHLNKWKAAADVLRSADGSQRAQNTKQTSEFHEQLRIAMAKAGLSVKAMAKVVGMSPATLQRWLRGAVPNVRARPAITRIEMQCGLPRGQMSGAVTKTIEHPATESLACFPVTYRQELSKRIKSTYTLRPRDFTPQLMVELQDLYSYKTARRPRLSRSSRGVWSVYASVQRPDQPVLPFAPTEVCVSYGIFTGILSSFLGYLGLERASGGLGRSQRELQTVAWLAVPDAIDGYMEFLEQRSGGLVHAGHERVARQIINLIQPKTGYLYQQPELANRLPVDMRPENWIEMCAEAKTLATEWKKKADSKSRDPALPISGMLALQEPLTPIINAVRELDRSALAAPEGSLNEAVNKRDALLLSLMTVNPLRIRNFVLMSVNPSRGGYIYSAGSQYRIAIPKAGFKNSNSSKVKDYDVGIPGFMAARIEEYLDNYRPVLVGANQDSGQLFPSSDTGGIYPSLGRQVSKLTRRLIPGCPGIGPQAFRHLVATAWLKKNPGDFLIVAELLNDRLETVIENYAHVSKDHSLARHSAQVEELFEDD